MYNFDFYKRRVLGTPILVLVSVHVLKGCVIAVSFILLEPFLYDLEMQTRETKQKRQTNGNKAIWLVCRTDTNLRGFWLVKRTLGWKKLHARELCRNQPILRCNVILQHDWPVEQCLLHIRVFFGGKTKRPCFDLFIHWRIKQVTSTYRKHFSRSYENRSNRELKQRRFWTTYVTRFELFSLLICHEAS